MDNSPLNKLPAELRNRVAELAHRRQRDFEIESFEHADQITFRPASASFFLRNPIGLALTCKRLHDETLPIFYNTNNFILHSYGTDTDVLSTAQAFIAKIGKTNSSALRHLTIFRDLGIPDPDFTQESPRSIRLLSISISNILTSMIQNINSQEHTLPDKAKVAVHVQVSLKGPLILRFDCNNLQSSCVAESERVRREKSEDQQFASALAANVSSAMLEWLWFLALIMALFECAGNCGDGPGAVETGSEERSKTV